MDNNKYRYTSPIGTMVIKTDGEFILRLDFKGNKEVIPENINHEENCDHTEPHCVTTARMWLDRYFKGENPSITELPIKPMGTDFQMKIWDILKSIPYGETITYGEIARAAGYGTDEKAAASQAVGGAVGKNPISIIIPCHRVIGKNGNLTGYAGGIDKKVFLLKVERHDMDNFRMPKIKNNKDKKEIK